MGKTKHCCWSFISSEELYRLTSIFKSTISNNIIENSDNDFQGVNYWKSKKPKQLKKSLKTAFGEKTRDLKQLNLSLVMLLGQSFLLLKGEN